MPQRGITVLRRGIATLTPSVEKVHPPVEKVYPPPVEKVHPPVGKVQNRAVLIASASCLRILAGKYDRALRISGG
jgi:hypothetical protein